ncbi:kinesin-like protein KIF20B isoform X3 [Artemia franciscana]|uniref:kinesin-like protein KIF20B isoform X3 n=1 Tax=Artemia franciscana TaxID=6661 RepID=UPI0032D9EB60
MDKTYFEQKHATSEITFSSIFKGNPKRNMKEAFEEAEKIKGTTEDIGILPRSIDVIFNSLGPTLSTGQYLKPERDSGYKILTDSEVLEEISLFSSLVKPIEDSKSKSQLAVPLIAKRQIPQNSIDISQRSRDSGSVTLTTDWMSTVWISVVEIYNDQIYDVLAMKKDKQERVLTAPLKLAEEGKGCFFIKNMQEILVRSADEAYQVIQVGIKNLRYASTNLNRSSSRSHSIFQIRVVRQSTKDGSVGKIHQIAFCDLAGAERTAKAQSKGERLQEACMINLSLATLHHVMDALRYNAKAKIKKPLRLRDSKLTCVLHRYFNGDSKTTMIVNISPDSRLIEETMHVLKFAALAQKVEIPRKRLQMPLNPIKRKRVSSLLEKRRSTLMSFNPGFNSTARLSSTEGPFSFRSSVATATLTELSEEIEEKPSAGELTYIKETENESESESEDEESKVETALRKDSVEALKKKVLMLERKIKEMEEENENLEIDLREEISKEYEDIFAQREKAFTEYVEELQERAEETAENRLRSQQEFMKKRREDPVANENLVKENRALKTANQDLEVQLKKLQSTLDDHKKALADSQGEIMRLTYSQALQGEKNFDFSRTETTFDIQMTFDEVMRKLEKRNREYDDIRQKYEDTGKNLEEAIAELDELETEHRKLSEEFEKSENTRQFMEAENEQLKDKITELENFKVLYLESVEKADEQDSADKEQISAMKLHLQDKDNLIEELREAREDLKKNFELQSLEIIQLNEELQHFQQAPEIAKTKIPKKPSGSSTNPIESENLIRQMGKLNIECADLKNQLLVISEERDSLLRRLAEMEKTDVDLDRILGEKKQLADGIVSLKTDYDIVDAQLAAALSDVSLLKEDITRLQTEKDTLSRENERLANIEHQLNTTLTEVTSLKEDATRLKTENVLLLEDVSQLKQALSDVSALKEEITQLKTENDNILREKEEQILNDESRIVKAQLAAALSDMSLLKEEIARYQTEKDILSKENERLANIELQLNITLTEITSLKEDATRFKTENTLLLEDVSQLRQALSEVSVLKEEITQLKTENDNVLKEKEEQILKDECRLKEALFEVSSLKEEAAKLNMECSRILKEKEETVAKNEEETSCLKSYIGDLQTKISDMEIASECLKKDVEDKSRLIDTLEKTLVNLTDKEREIVKQIDDLTSLREKVSKLESEKNEILAEKEEILAKSENEIHSLKSEIIRCGEKDTILREDIRRLNIIIDTNKEQLQESKHKAETSESDAARLKSLVYKIDKKITLSPEELLYFQEVTETEEETDNFMSISMLPSDISIRVTKPSPARDSSKSGSKPSRGDEGKRGRRTKTPTRKAIEADDELIPPTVRRLRPRKKNEEDVSKVEASEETKENQGDSTIGTSEFPVSPTPTKKPLGQVPKSSKKLFTASYDPLDCSPVSSVAEEPAHRLVEKKLTRKASKK